MDYLQLVSDSAVLVFPATCAFVYILIMWWCHVPSVFVLKWHVSLTPPCLCLISRHFVSTPDFCLLRLVCGYLSPVCLSIFARSYQSVTCAILALCKSHYILSACNFDPCLIFDLTLLDSVFWILLPWTLFDCWIFDLLPACWLTRLSSAFGLLPENFIKTNTDPWAVLSACGSFTIESLTTAYIPGGVFVVAR